MELEVVGKVQHPAIGDEQLVPSGAVHSARNIGITPHDGCTATSKADGRNNMEPKEFVGIIVDSEQLSGEVSAGKGDKCLDFKTGNLVPATDCPDHETGEGRPAIRAGKRFIRIPNLDEVRLEIKAFLDDQEFGDYEDADELLPDTPGAKEIREAMAPMLEAMREDPEYKELCHYTHLDMAAEVAAQRWIAILRPPIMVGWFEDGFGVTQVYDPAVLDWVHAR
jgi:hypothetical protein